ncbi:hypothetical protein NA57DRAFT_79957 [Rhizodiscina lignyota]|uniref:Uncharacterized protein n=1 Tax=Rhizodiscina lignyota TaxID=1504668 RepID=A0A9P4IA39_9PEZI|nr:hypothetical protein NA57DRAFT_79957 [Rhizodiscina lignyota]
MALSSFVNQTSPSISITPTPPPQVDPIAIGSTTVPAYSSWTTWTCGLGSTWTTLMPYGRCRTTDSSQVPIYTGCVNASILVGPFDTTPCSGTGAQTSCVTGSIFYNNHVTVTNYECWPSWTDGNWYAWRETSSRQPPVKVIAPAVIVPVVAIIVGVVLFCLRLRRRRRARRAEFVIGQTPPGAEMTHSTVVTTLERPKEMDNSMPGCELEGHRRISELSSPLPRYTSIAGPLDGMGRATREDDQDDTSSYHTTNSRIIPQELDAAYFPSDSHKRIERRQRFFDWVLNPARV